MSLYSYPYSNKVITRLRSRPYYDALCRWDYYKIQPRYNRQLSSADLLLPVGHQLIGNLHKNVTQPIYVKIPRGAKIIYNSKLISVIQLTKEPSV